MTARKPPAGCDCAVPDGPVVLPEPVHGLQTARAIATVLAPDDGSVPSLPPTDIAMRPVHTDTDIYHTDFHAWIERQATLLRQGRVHDIDSERLAEELEEMGRRERNELASRLIVLIAHMLKWEHQPEHRSSSWRESIVEQRVQVGRELRLNPSLQTLLTEAIADAYPDALRIATKETGLQATALPDRCPYRDSEILDED